ncbi:hypothetical protein ACMBCN_02470, partial [Candidatus Liberibacter asiaticus]|nr:hypothetical protein [Candidatus Liberibacter asiaticus]
LILSKLWEIYVFERLYFLLSSSSLFIENYNICMRHCIHFLLFSFSSLLLFSTFAVCQFLSFFFFFF